MSVRVMSRIWEHAPYEGGSLLVLLALADFCDDQDMCFPDQPSIAAKARLTERQVRTLLAKLREEGEILMVSGRGRGNRTWYCVLSGLSAEDRAQKRKSFPVIISGNKNRKSGEKRKSGADKSGSLEQEKRKFDALSRGSSGQPDAPNPSPIRHDPSCDPSRDVGTASFDASPTPLADPPPAPPERPPRKLAEPPTPAPIRDTLAEVCGVNMGRSGVREDKLEVNTTGKLIWGEQSAAGKTPEDVAKLIRYVATWCLRNAWECTKDRPPDAPLLPRPTHIRKYWTQAANSYRSRSRAPAPPPAALPAGEVASGAELAAAFRKGAT